MARIKLTDRYLKSLKPAAAGRPYDIMDTAVDRMGVRVMGTATHPVVSFIVYTRFPDAAGVVSKGPTRRALGSYLDSDDAPGREEATVEELLMLDALTLAEARRKAQAWLELIARGIDPATDKKQRRQAVIQKQKNTLDAVFEDWVRDKLSGERKGEVVERDVRREFLPNLGSKPITEITDLDILAITNAKKRTAPVQARNELGHIKRLFTWAIDQRIYGIKTSPCDSLKPSKIIGKKRRGKRILFDDELFALWRAVKRLPYPYRQVYQLLILSALQLNEAADASWSEFNPAVVRALRQRKKGEGIDWTTLKPEQLSWIIPAERMKGRNEDARPHAVPLTAEILEILESLPLFKKGDYLFSMTHGEKPSWIGDKVKKVIDERMVHTLKALARQRGDDPARVELESWTNHDIRRSVRSNLSRLKVTEESREAVLAHARQGIAAVYDVYDYFDEKREALELWAARLRSVVGPPPAKNNVVALRGTH
jgi:Arm DNA-binding domain